MLLQPFTVQFSKSTLKPLVYTLKKTVFIGISPEVTKVTGSWCQLPSDVIKF